jgi:hypothetical protein
LKMLYILVLSYLLLTVADDFVTWAFDKVMLKSVRGYDRDELPKTVHRKVSKLQSAKRTARHVIRGLKVLLIVPIVSALIVGVGIATINF